MRAVERSVREVSLRERRRRGWGCRGRPSRIPKLHVIRPEVDFNPWCTEELKGEPIILYHHELEAMRLVHLEDLTVEEASLRMGLPRATFWRILESGRRKVVMALVEGRPISIREYGKV